MGDVKAASAVDVIVCIAVTVFLLGMSVALFGSDSSQGANQIALVCGAALATGIGIRNGHRWKVIEETIVSGISTALPAVIILFSVGSLIGAWMLCGTVPTMIYYGMLLLDPAVFYAAACVLCAITALSIGSSWTVAGTLGIGLIGIASGMGLSVEITAGAIIGGAYFGDKMSPLSDTTNLAPAVTGIDIFTHIRHMTWTTAPSLLVALVLFALLGLGESGARPENALDAALALLDDSFTINPLLLAPVALVVYMAARKVPAVATILSGVAAGIVIALLFQPHAVLAMAGDSAGHGALRMFRGVWIVLFDGFSAATGDANLDSLLSRGGMSSMLTTVWLVLAAMAFGAAMEKAGILDTLVKNLVKLSRSTGSLIATTVGTCLGMNTLTGDQYIAIVLPGRMFKVEYRRRGLHEKNLARVLEDAGTITSPLVPWNTCGAYMAATLGVPTLAYLPFCFFNLINPVISLFYGFTGFRIERIAERAADTPATAGVGTN
ncbi:MAG: Na+/H+ antiporter NhaC [Gammaproteobacteria bacterium]|nr:Na+/H+ antiporter NhaC [Gammaproteobacteria bacterium]